MQGSSKERMLSNLTVIFLRYSVAGERVLLYVNTHRPTLVYQVARYSE